MTLSISTSSKGIRFAYPRYEYSELSRSETNDCFVRAIASAFDKDYDTAHNFVKTKFGRINRRGTFGAASTLRQIGSQWDQKITDITGNSDYNVGYTMVRTTMTRAGIIKKTAMSVSSFLKDYPVGRFVIIVSGHAFSILDGVIVGNFQDGQRTSKKIYNAFQIGEIKKPEVKIELKKEIATGTKKCKCCGHVHPISEFYKLNTAPDGHHSRCKKCYNDAKKK